MDSKPTYSLVAAWRIHNEITTVPAAIRRLAEEVAREARIGSTIVVDGVELPYRPVD